MNNEKNQILISFDNSKLLFIKEYEEEESEIAFEKFSELYFKRKDQTNVTLCASSVFFEKFIKPRAYKDFIQNVNFHLSEAEGVFLNVKEGDLIKEFEDGMSEAEAAIALIKKI